MKESGKLIVQQMNYYIINSKVGEIGEIKQNVKCRIRFTFEEVEELGSQPIKEIKPGCGCTSTNTEYGEGGKYSLIATYDSGMIPYHIKEDKQKFKKRIYLTMEDGTEHTLEFHGTRLRK